MAQTKHEIQGLLAAAGSEPRQRFGQNFMIDQNLVRVVAEAGLIEPDDVVIEVGPGTGTLTEELLARAGRVIAVEIDRDLAKMLRERFGARRKFELIEGDALDGKHAIHPDLKDRIAAAQHGGRCVRLVANLPYNIAAPLIIEMLLTGVETLSFTVQKEVADRLRAGAGSEAYGPLSVVAQLLARVQMLRTLPPQAFWPAPKVDSALVRMTRDDRLGGEAREFSRFVHALFSSRRKTLRKALAHAGFDSERSLVETKIDPQHRPEVLTPERFLALFRAARASVRQDDVR